ncbi:MAG: MFS transporter [Elusimicrobia bacterium]|nr:MFS transporter [Elusimicrobiota bacterium]
MLMLRALRRRPVALLWAGQALSAIGDEIFRVALIWLAVGLIGADAGYIGAAQSAALLLLSLFGGRWADRWDHRRTMIAVDSARGLIVLLPVLAFRAGAVSLPLLVFVALTLSALSAFFDPALQAYLPAVSGDAQTLEAANGLMSTIARLARAVGPGVVGLLSGLVPTIYFFTLDALSFGASALSVAAARPERPADIPAGADSVEPDRLGAAWRSLRRSPLMSYLLFVKSAGGGLWALAYGLGLALLVQRLAPGDVRAFGLAIASYGAGNLAGALWVGNIRRQRPAEILFGGYVWMGLGFVAMGLAPSLRALFAACAWAGFGGPVNDLPFVDMVQRLYPVREIPRVFRLRMAVETGAGLILLTASPRIFRAWTPGPVIAFCGAAFVAFGAYGWARYCAVRQAM